MEAKGPVGTIRTKIARGEISRPGPLPAGPLNVGPVCPKVIAHSRSSWRKLEAGLGCEMLRMAMLLVVLGTLGPAVIVLAIMDPVGTKNSDDNDPFGLYVCRRLTRTKGPTR